MHRRLLFYSLLSWLTIVQANHRGRLSIESLTDPFKQNYSARIGDYPFPTNPMNDRAHGYLLQGKAQTALANYGN